MKMYCPSPNLQIVLCFMTGYIKEQKVNRILMDRGLSVNIIPKSTMHDLEITVEELSKSLTMIKGFNLEG